MPTTNPIYSDMNSYEERQEAKREAIRERAEKIRAKAEHLHKEGWERLQSIPFGQPILIGHHSEKSDRSFRSGAVRKIDRSVELATHADELESRADNIGTGGISSDDPEAIAKLELKLLNLKAGHAEMVSQNKAARTNKIEKPYAAYQLANSSAAIRSVQKRIDNLKARAETAPMTEKSGNGWTMYEDKDTNRIVITFSGIPSESIRKSLRSYGFLWTPSRTAWTRRATNSRFAVERAYQILSAL